MLHSSTIQNYAGFVEVLAREKQNKVFFNSGPNHAAIVLSRIFKYAKNVVKIHCSGFTGTISNDPDYLYYLEDFLKRGGKLVVLAEQDLTNSTAKVFPLLKKYSRQVQYYQTALRVAIPEKGRVHFAIGDNSMLRIETDTTDFTAQVNFGDKKQAAVYNRLFEEMAASGTHTKPIALA